MFQFKVRGCMLLIKIFTFWFYRSCWYLFLSVRAAHYGLRWLKERYWGMIYSYNVHLAVCASYWYFVWHIYSSCAGEASWVRSLIAARNFPRSIGSSMRQRLRTSHTKTNTWALIFSTRWNLRNLGLKECCVRGIPYFCNLHSCISS